MPNPIADLQERFAFLERHVEQLDDVIRRLADRTDALARDLGAVRAATEVLRTRVPEAPPSDGPPPHWGRRPGAPE